MDQALQQYNQAYGDLAPAPFERAPLSASLEKLQTVLKENGHNDSRLVQADYTKLRDLEAVALNLLDQPDLRSISLPAHQDVLVTHKTFTTTVERIEEALSAAEREEYTPADTTSLVKLYDSAIARIPAEGMGFESNSRIALLNEIEKVRDLLGNHVYETPTSLEVAASALEEKLELLRETPLPAETYRLIIRYSHPDKTAPTPLIHAHFTENGEAVTETLDIHPGEEIRWNLNHPLIKRFAGYRPVSFHLNSDDSSLKLVRVLTNSKGEQVIAFQGDAASLAHGGSLEIHYVEGEDERESASEGNSVNQPRFLLPLSQPQIHKIRAWMYQLQ